MKKVISTILACLLIFAALVFLGKGENGIISMGNATIMALVCVAGGSFFSWLSGAWRIDYE